MSIYLKSGPSRYPPRNLNARKYDRPESAESTEPDSAAMARNPSGYTNNDERLFKELISATQFSINTRRVQSHKGPRYTTPYTTQDIELFDNLLSGQHNSDRARDSASDPGSSTAAIKIMEFDDHPPHDDRASPVATKLSASVRCYD